MKERPIIMNTDSVRAILDGRKTQTRRVIDPQPKGWSPQKTSVGDTWAWCVAGDMDYAEIIRCKYGKPGDLLWVKETTLEDFHGFYNYWANYLPDEQKTVNGVPVDVLGGIESGMYWKKSSLFMKKKYARIWLEIINLRAERLLEISEKDAIAEGITYPENGIPIMPARKWFQVYWDSINARRGYPFDANPWVWVIEFEQVKS